MSNYCISIDWLQTFNHCGKLQPGNYFGQNYTFRLTLQNIQTAQFLDVYAVYVGPRKVATIQQTPRTSVLNPLSTIIKLENRVLYCEKYIELLYDLNNALGLHYKGITRIDICYDCNELAEGRSVSRFLREFITHEPQTVGHIIRNGSPRFTIHGTRYQSSVPQITSIRWGSPNTAIGAYCYNKSLELTEVKNKPWIVEMWEKNGLIHEVDQDKLNEQTPKQIKHKIENEGLQEYVKKSVWRFEISIKSQGKDILNMQTGELFRLSPKYIEHYENIYKLFHIYAAKVFDFRINTGQNKTRYYKKLKIFEDAPQVTCKPIKINHYADTGRMEKACINKLDKLSEEYSDMAESVRASLITARNFLSELTGKKASILHAEKYLSYLNSLKGHKFLEEQDKHYLATIQLISTMRDRYAVDCNPDYIYANIFGDTLEDALRNTRPSKIKIPPTERDIEWQQLLEREYGNRMPIDEWEEWSAPNYLMADMP